jgi:hypothetical protein
MFLEYCKNSPFLPSFEMMPEAAQTVLERAKRGTLSKSGPAKAADATIFPVSDLVGGWSHHLGNAGCGPQGCDGRALSHF